MENFQMTEGKFLATGNYLKQEEINENTLQREITLNKKKSMKIHFC